MGGTEPRITCYPVRSKKIGSFPLPNGGVEQLVARKAHILEVDGSSPSPASDTNAVRRGANKTQTQPRKGQMEG